MNTENDLIEKIDRYLSDQMSLSEKVEFEMEMEHDLGLKNEVKLQKTIRFGLENQHKSSGKKDRLSIHRLLNEIEAEREENKKKTRRLNRLWIGGLVVAAAVIALLLMVNFPANNLSDEAIIAKYGGLSREMRSIADPTKANQKILSFYDTQQYQEGLDHIRFLQESDSIDNYYLEYLSGFFHLAQNDSLLAIETFRKLALNPANENNYFDQAYMQWGLLYIQFHNREEAKKIFEAMLENPLIAADKKDNVKEILSILGN